MEVNNLKKNTFVREVYGGNVKYEDIKDGELYLINYNGTEFKSKVHKEGESFACNDESHGMRIKFKEQNMKLGHISLMEIKRKGGYSK